MKFLYLFLLLTCLQIIPFEGHSFSFVQKDTLRSGSAFQWKGFLDLYYGYNLKHRDQATSPFLVSSANNNSPQLNLGYLHASYQGKNFRATLIPAIGTYMQANYAGEPAKWRYLVESNAGFRLSKKGDLWLDAGILGSPFTNEGPISRELTMYSRSLAPENVPYYLNGVRLSGNAGKKISWSSWIVSGWQQIVDVNNKVSWVNSLKWHPSEFITVTYNQFFGNEGSDINPTFTTRSFHDFYVEYEKNQFRLTTCFYVGKQSKLNEPSAEWWQYNTTARYRISKLFSVSGRIEYFNDPNRVIYRPANTINGFKVFGAGAGINIHPTKWSMFRFDLRYLGGNERIFPSAGTYDNGEIRMLGNLSIWF
ncbi:MAG: porin [Bacteroidetes bacterium]|nr:porin [Bacteroidota bacterium]